jgi:hypothetical protein
MFPQKVPSTDKHNLPPEPIVPAILEDVDTQLIRRFLTVHKDTFSSLGPSNALFLGLAALMELHLSSPSRNVPIFGESGDTLLLRYYGHPNDLGYVHHLRVDTRIMWARLRTEVDEQRSTLLWITRFMHQHFDLNHDGMEVACKDLKERFECHFADLELAEIRLRDHIGMQSSQKSTEMAEQSIRESKRVMLRKSPYLIFNRSQGLTGYTVTALAFIFIPISLATSIYGMVSSLKHDQSVVIK